MMFFELFCLATCADVMTIRDMAAYGDALSFI